MLQIITYLITLVFTLIVSTNYFNPAIFLGPDKNTYKLFDKYPYAMKNDYQIWRLITPVLLHAGFTHLVFNLITQVIFGSMLE